MNLIRVDVEKDDDGKIKRLKFVGERVAEEPEPAEQPEPVGAGAAASEGGSAPEASS